DVDPELRALRRDRRERRRWRRGPLQRAGPRGRARNANEERETENEGPDGPPFCACGVRGSGLPVVGLDLGVADLLLDLALGLVPLAAQFGRRVAAELAGLFLDGALGLLAFALDLVLPEP